MRLGPAGAEERQGQVNGRRAEPVTRANARSVIKADCRRDRSGLPDVGSLILPRYLIGDVIRFRNCERDNRQRQICRRAGYELCHRRQSREFREKRSKVPEATRRLYELRLVLNRVGLWSIQSRFVYALVRSALGSAFGVCQDKYRTRTEM